MNKRAAYTYSIVLLTFLFTVLVSCEGTVGTEEIVGLQQSEIELFNANSGDAVTLYAGQDIDVGEVIVVKDSDILKVTFDTNQNWCLLETHLHIWNDESERPVNRSGNPVPGQFEYSETHECVDSYTFHTDKNPDMNWNIAAHAVVVQTEAAPFYASFVFESNQGLKNNGTAVDAERSDPDNALDFETGMDVNNFFSLGFGGYITLGFNYPIINGPGDDIRVIEDTWGGNFPLEKANVYVSQDGEEWKLLGEADNTDLDVIHTFSFFDLDAIEWDWAQFVKVVDTTDPNIHNGNADAYDVNAVEAIHDYVDYESDETAWGEGIRFVERGNWATYFVYNDN